MANPEIPKRLLQLDEITRGDHFYIADDDLCFHLWAYVKGGLVTDHPSNQLIRNLQIPVDQRANVYRWRYKGRAIRYAADALSSVVPLTFSSVPLGFRPHLPQQRVRLTTTPVYWKFSALLDRRFQMSES